MKMRWIGLIAAALSAGSIARGSVSLYDGSNATTPDPVAQGSLEYDLPIGTHYVTSGGATSLDTTAAMSQQYGFFDYNELSATPHLLNSQVATQENGGSFAVTADVKVLSENHGADTTQRGGLSLIVLDASHQGVELDFWQGKVSAQDEATANIFNFAENATIDTTVEHHYVVQIAGGNYTLFADGQQLLTHAVRDYSASSVPVYGQANFIFLGDNTTEASSSWQFSSLAVVPEPGIGVAAVGVMGVWAGMRRRAKQ